MVEVKLLLPWQNVIVSIKVLSTFMHKTFQANISGNNLRLTHHPNIKRNIFIKVRLFVYRYFSHKISISCWLVRNEINFPF
jgi:hypothetical protein